MQRPRGYQLTEEELKFDCKKLTGTMQIRILQMRGYDTQQEHDGRARGMQSLTTPIFGGTKEGIDPDGAVPQDRAMLEAYNRQLAIKKCKTFDLDAELGDGPTDADAALQTRNSRRETYGGRRAVFRPRASSGVNVSVERSSEAPMPKPKHEPADRPAAFRGRRILLAGVVVAAVALGYLAPVGWPGSTTAAAHYIGLGIGAAGVALLVWAIMTLRRHGTTVLPDVGATTLVTDGPYWRYRNPIYLADAMILLGIAELTKNVWFVAAAAAFAALVTWLAILPEERHLERRFGKAYLDYKAQVAPLDLRKRDGHRLRRKRTRLHRRAEGEHRPRSRRVDAGDRRAGPAAPQRHHRLAAPQGAYVLQGVVAGAHPPQRRQADLRRRAERRTGATAPHATARRRAATLVAIRGAIGRAAAAPAPAAFRRPLRAGGRCRGAARQGQGLPAAGAARPGADQVGAPRRPLRRRAKAPSPSATRTCSPRSASPPKSCACTWRLVTHPFDEVVKKGQPGGGLGKGEALSHMLVLTDARQVDQRLWSSWPHAAAKANG